jgi:hypothetical protein
MIPDFKRCGECERDLPAGEFHVKKNRKGELAHLSAACKPCSSERTKRWQRENRDRAQSLYIRGNLKKRGLTLEQYEEMLAFQGNVCGICKREAAERTPYKRLAVDHCHETLVVRGLLCTPCNSAIGLLMEDVEVLREAIAYLESWDEANREANREAKGATGPEAA